MSRFVRTGLGVVLILLFFTPIPGGAIFLASGLSILICSSLPFALFVQSLRRRFRLVDAAFQWVEKKLGERWASGMMHTRPDADPRDHFANR
jgi:hypothetical protein